MKLEELSAPAVSHGPAGVALAEAPLDGGSALHPSQDLLLSCYRRMFLIRGFEEALPPLYRAGLITGTGHLCLGQEATAVAVGAALGDEDVIFSNHRGHGHFLALTGDAPGLLRELLGLGDGLCGGVGGSQHLCVPGRFYSNGILGGMMACATGYAAAVQSAAPHRAVVGFLGDGALGEGVVYEAFNLASLWRLPILFVVEDNGYSQSTPKSRHLAGQIPARLEAFGIPADSLATTDLRQLWPVVREALAGVRAGAGPRGIVVEAPRLCGHSVNSPEPVAASGKPDAGETDPVRVLRSQVGEDAAARIEAEVSAYLQDLFNASWVRSVRAT